MIPKTFECYHCECISTRNRKASAVMSCPYCHKTIHIWMIRKFFKTIRSGLKGGSMYKVNYNRIVTINANKIEMVMEFI